MPAPISAGVLGMVRTSRCVTAEPAADVGQAQAGGDADDELARQVAASRRQRFLHDLRLDR